MSVSRAKSEITATEFLRWVTYIHNDANEFHREDYFLAEIAYQIYICQHILGGKPKLTKKDFLIKFEQVSQKVIDNDKVPVDETPTDRLMRESRNKAAILGHLGLVLNPDGTVTHRGMKDPRSGRGHPGGGKGRGKGKILPKKRTTGPAIGTPGNRPPVPLTADSPYLKRK